MQNLALILVLPLALVSEAVVATPVEHTNGVTGTLYPEDYELKGDSHFTAVTRQLLPYHLITHDERRGLAKRSPLLKTAKAGVSLISDALDREEGSVAAEGSGHLTKRSPLFPFPIPLAKLKKPKKKKPKIFGKKVLKKGFPFGKKAIKKGGILGIFGKKAIKKGFPFGKKAVKKGGGIFGKLGIFGKGKKAKPFVKKGKKGKKGKLGKKAKPFGKKGLKKGAKGATALTLGPPSIPAIPTLGLGAPAAATLGGGALLFGIPGINSGFLG